MKQRFWEDCDFGRYQVLLRIASGGMGDVYAARVCGEAGFHKLVAVKRLHRHLAADPKFVTMFLDEARIAAFISSPYVVSTLDQGRTAGQGIPFLVMELVVGGTLQTIAASSPEKRLPTGLAVEWIAQAALGLHDAHEAVSPSGRHLGVIHRDVSPQNVLIGLDGLAKISDFGVASATERLTQTASDEVKGKWAYFAPERVTNDTLDRRCDVFSLGVVAWEMLSGRRLFYSRNPIEVMERILRDPIPRLDAIRSDVPSAIARVVERALHKNRAERFATGRDLAFALREAALRDAPSPAADVARSYVRAHGGDELRHVQERIKRAIDEHRSAASEARLARTHQPKTTATASTRRHPVVRRPVSESVRP